MKRDLDLCRQLLADIEGHGPDCTVTALRPGVTGEADETLRYHVRLLIDAGLVKEVDRPSGAAPCVRLTNAGHELLELAHSEARWREAKWVVAERTGTQSLTVIRSVLARWAYEAAVNGETWRPRRAYRGYRPTAYLRPAHYSTVDYPRSESRYRFEREVEPVAELRFSEPRLTEPRFVEPRFTTTTVRSPYSYLERFDWRDGAEREAFYRDNLYREPRRREGYYCDVEAFGGDGVTLPTYVV
jgi:hypothetical protein